MPCRSTPHTIFAIARLALAALVLAAGTAVAADIRPAVIYAVGQKFDKSFNEGAYTGAERFAAETGTVYREFQPQNPAEFTRAVRLLVRHGVTDIVAVGYYYATPLAQLAPRYPDVRFTLVDATVADQPNVRSIVYREQEGAFLIGMLAAMASTTGTIGFVGALDIPLVRRFVSGYRQGAGHVRPDTSVIVNFVGTTPAAFNDPTRAGEVARSQIERGADVVFAGAGASNFGVFQTAVDLGIYAIGLDANQNYLHPGTILTSQLKRVDQVVFDTFREAASGTWNGGVRSLGLAEQGVDYAVDEHNAALITEEMSRRVESARQGIIDGTIRVSLP